MIILYAGAYLSMAYDGQRKQVFFILGTLTIMTVDKHTAQINITVGKNINATTNNITPSFQIPFLNYKI